MAYGHSAPFYQDKKSNLYPSYCKNCSSEKLEKLRVGLFCKIMEEKVIYRQK